MIIQLKPESPFDDIVFKSEPLGELSPEALARHQEYLERWSRVIGW